MDLDAELRIRRRATKKLREGTRSPFDGLPWAMQHGKRFSDDGGGEGVRELDDGVVPAVGKPKRLWKKILRVAAELLGGSGGAKLR